MLLAAQLALRRGAGPAARAALPGEPPRRLLQHAGRRAVHGQLDHPRLLARHRRRGRGGAHQGAQRQRVPRRPFRRHRLHRALRLDQLRHHRRAARAEPGYKKVRGLVLLEGGGGSTARGAADDDTLDRIKAKFDGGLFGAVRDNAPRCVDGTTPCTIPTEATDCAGQTPPSARRRRPPTPWCRGYSIRASSPTSETAAIQGVLDLDSGQVICQVDQGAPGNNAVAKVPDIAGLAVIPPATVEAASARSSTRTATSRGVRPFLAMSVGAAGTDGRRHADLAATSATARSPSAGPTTGRRRPRCPASVVGPDKEVTRFDRVLWTFFAGETNFSDWYYPARPERDERHRRLHGGCARQATPARMRTKRCAQSINLDSTRCRSAAAVATSRISPRPPRSTSR